MRRVLLPILTLAFLLFAGAGCFTTTVTYQNSNAGSALSAEEATERTATLRITKPDGSVRQSVETVPEGTSALTLLEQVSASQGFTLTTEQFDFGKLVTGIDGVAADATHFWLFSVNNEPAIVGAGDYTVQNGDTIEFRFEAM